MKIKHRPDFFIVGAPRCGTTAMHAYLKQHPEIFMPETKEPTFFGKDLHIPLRIVSTEGGYLSLFDGAGEAKRIGEASTAYLYSKSAPVEIKQFSPSTSIIIMLRNPVEMMYSLHSELLVVGAEDITDFKTALDAEEKRKQGLCLPKRPVMTEILFYRELATYTQHVPRYLDVFGRENVHIIIYDDLKNDTAGVYRRVLGFLGVRTDFQPELRIVNPSETLRSKTLHNFLMKPSQVFRPLSIVVPIRLRQFLFFRLTRLNATTARRPPMDPELRRRLQTEFAPEVERLSQLLDRDLTHWSKN